MKTDRIESAYGLAREIYAEQGVDTTRALDRLKRVSISLPCWQGDDVGGFEKPESALSGGGLAVTGSYAGKARTIDELRRDLSRALSLLPGFHRVNVHSIYGDFRGKPVQRNEIGPEHFRGWIEWAEQEKLKLDFNATCFSHPMAASGLTLSHKDKMVRTFWIQHVKNCRKTSAHIGRELKSPCLHNLWIPDGSKEVPVSRASYRSLLRESLDEIFATHYPSSVLEDSLESKLFGIGSESFVAGSLEFYLGYALAHGQMICLDLGHFHPTESVADKISAILQFWPGLVLHLSRGVRWDSDHVVVLNEEVLSVAEEVVACRALDRIRIALDFFDASLNRVGAWVIGARATLKAFLFALLQPRARLAEVERSEKMFDRLALREEFKAMPFGAVWDYYCLREGVPPGAAWMDEIRRYEKDVLSRRR
jgi:L-rhamnose isomerase